MPITEHQRKLRKSHIGSSDAPIVMGVNKWGDIGQLYWSKVSDEDPDFGNAATEAGNLLEDAVLDWAAAELNCTLTRNQFRVSESNPVMAANYDALVVDKPWAVEAKTCGIVRPVTREELDEWGEPGTDEVPDHYLIQCHHQITVLGLDCVYLAALIGGRGFALYRINRDDELCNIIELRENRFWEDHVKPRIPPEGGEFPPLPYIMARKRAPGKHVTLDDNALVLADLWEEHKRKRLDAGKDEDRVKAELLSLLDDAEFGDLPDGRTVRVKRVTKRSLNVDEFRHFYPEIYEKHLRSTEYPKAELLKAKPEA